MAERLFWKLFWGTMSDRGVSKYSYIGLNFFVLALLSSQYPILARALFLDFNFASAKTSDKFEFMGYVTFR